MTPTRPYYNQLCQFVLFFIAAAASFNGFYHSVYLREPGTLFYFTQGGFDALVDGTGSRPYVYRQLLPLSANWIDAHVPQDIKDMLYQLKGPSGVPLRSRFFNSQMAQDPRYFIRYSIIYTLTFIFAFIATYALYYVGIAACFPPIASAFTAVVMILAFPYFCPWGGFFYDFPEMAFFALAFWMALKLDWWWMIPLVALATLNKESFLLFIPSLYPVLRTRHPRVATLTGGPAPFRWTVYRLSFLTSSSSKLCYRRGLPPKAVEALVCCV